MSVCPNKNSSEWREMADSIGEEYAYDAFVTMGNNIPIIGIAPNGKDSTLYSQLRDRYTESLANKLWYMSKTNRNMKADDAYLDSNGELRLEDVIGSDIKSANYTSNIDDSVNNVINTAHAFVRDTAIRFANRIKAYPKYGVLKDTMEELAKTGIIQDIADIDLTNLADALASILKYDQVTLLNKGTDKIKGGILYRLEQYEKLGMEAILADDVERANFLHFMKRASTFLHGFTNVIPLNYTAEGNFTEAEQVINDLVKKIKELDQHVTNATAKFNGLLEKFNEMDLSNYTTNPEIVAGMRDIIQAGDDENYFQMMLDALADTNNAFVANMVKKYIVKMTNADKDSNIEVDKFHSLLKSSLGISDVTALTAGHFMKYIEHIDGKPTGRFVQKYDWNKFYAAKKEYFDRLREKYPVNMRHSDQYVNEVLAWYSNNEVATMTEEEAKLVIAQKKAELSSTEYNAWYNKNFTVSPYGTYVRIGGRTFKQPSDNYINADWNAVKDDPLFQYMNKVILEYGEKFGRDNMFLEGYTPVQRETDGKRDSFWEAWSKVGPSRHTPEFLGEDNEMIRLLTVPMMYKLGEQQDYIRISEKLQDESPLDYTKRVLQEVEDAGFGVFKNIDDIKKRNAEIHKENLIAHGAEVDYNLAHAFTRFIKEASRISAKFAMQDEFELGLAQIQNLKFTKRSPSNKPIVNAAGSRISNKRIFATEKKTGSNLEQHYREWLEAIFYDNFDLDEGQLTKVGKILMKYSSAKYMWLNVTAGINNVAFGKVQIKMEQHAKYFADKEDFKKADSMYLKALSDVIANLGTENSDTLTGGLIKYFDIGQNTNEKDYASGFMHHSLMNTDTLYLLNDLGEHYMQNNMLLAMLHSHRLVDGRFISEIDFRYNNYKDALYKILTSKERVALDEYYKVRLENEGNKDSKKDYLYDFLLTLNTTKQQEFIAERKKLDASSSVEFKKYTRASDVFELKDHKVSVKEGSTLKNSAIAEFRYKVLKVNQSLHGIYNLDDSNLTSRRAIGKLFMQFRKWMRPGWNRRFGSKFWGSYWNEGRQSWDKGSFVKLIQFLSSGAKANKTAKYMDEEEANRAIRAMKNITSSIANFSKNCNIYYNLLDDSDKASVNRALTELSYLVSVVAVGMILQQLAKGMGDDDKPYLLDMGIYQTDRLMSELMMYTPFGLINETQKILRSPAAVTSTLTDVVKFLNSAFAFPFQSDEKRIYQTGIYNNEYKIKINAIRTIPILNKIQTLKRIDKFNKYYILFRG